MNAAIAELQSLSAADVDRNKQKQDHSVVVVSSCTEQTVIEHSSRPYLSQFVFVVA